MKSIRNASEKFLVVIFVVLAAAVLLLAAARPTWAQGGVMTIGEIQGSGEASPSIGDRVRFRGVVTGFQEDRNTRGDIYYTMFVQDLPQAEDGDPATSDAIAVFFGQTRPQIPLGATVMVEGEVTEFFGFTEIAEDDLVVTVEGEEGAAIPEAIVIDPPAELEAQRAYFEPLEGMLVRFDGPVRVTGPTHVGCGFAVEAASDPAEPVFRRQVEDPIGRIIPVLYPTDVDCTDMIPLKTGDMIEELSGVLIYNFDEFKILLADPASLVVTPADMPPLTALPELAGGQVSAVTINAHDWFDTESLDNNPDETVLPPDVLAIKEGKLAQTIAGWLGCPTLIAFQEVEHKALLDSLAEQLAPACGFTYTVSHAESADNRGIDNGLLSDPTRVVVQSVAPQQVCSLVPTEYTDDSVDCKVGEFALFARPPLRVDMAIDGVPAVAFVNHFKSKRGGEQETSLQRLAQARYQNALVADLLAADPELPVLVMGDLNDYELSAPLLTLTDPAKDGQLVNALTAVPEDERYSYVFGGVANLLDQILVSPVVDENLQQAGILHINADFPFSWTDEQADPTVPHRFSDHDLPWIVWDLGQAAAPTATPEPTPTAEPTATPVPPTATTSAPTEAPSPTVAPQPAAPPPADPATPVWVWIVTVLAAVVLGVIIWRVLRRKG